MNYVYLRQGDQLPAVGVLQMLLNRMGERVHVDGIFGRRTHDAVVRFQRTRLLRQDGIVGEKTWPRLCSNAGLRILDCVDVFDPSLYNAEVKDIRRVGGNPLLIGGMCNGVEQAVQQIVSHARRDLFMLRFHGHGARGLAGISSGKEAISANERADISLATLSRLRPVLHGLRNVFGPYGCVQFMHCETGGGPGGRRLLNELSLLLTFPVSAGIRTQYGGGLTTFHFEGPTYTATPDGSSLGIYCRSLPDFAPYAPP